MDKVTAILTGAGYAALLFLPLAVLFRIIVEGPVRRKHPGLLKIFPEFIWILCFGIVGGILYSLILPQELLVPPYPDPSGAGRGASTLANTGIVFVVMIAGATLWGRDLRKFASSVRSLMWPATIGAAGVILGSTAVAYVLRITLLSSPVYNGLWEKVWRGALANANGWVGDSTTFFPTLAIIAGKLEVGQFAPPAILLDPICGLLWLGLVTRMVAKYSPAKSQPIPAAAQPSPASPSPTRNATGENRGVTLVVFCLLGIAATVCLRALPEIPWLRESPMRPPLAVLIYLLTFVAGYFLARWNSVIASKPARGWLLLVAIGLIGLNAGLTLKSDINNAAELLKEFNYLCVIAVGAFAGHIIMLRLFGRAPWGLLFVASMCSIGGLATAPQVAREYSEDLEEPSYLVALWCNLISIACLLMLWPLSTA